jgi:protein-L-isoaspartate(D-aspartate) O-methyltransferase
VLGKLARRVVAVEEDAGLAESAKKLLSSLPNVDFRQSPLVAGSPKDAPFDAILIEGAVEYLPQALADQLKEGGRVLAAEQDEAAKVGAVGLSKLVCYRKVRSQMFKTVLRDANMALLAAFHRPRAFKL